VLAVKGASQYGRPIIGRPSSVDVNWRGATLRGGVKLWPIGTDTAKHLLYGRMRITTVGPGYVHVPKAYAATDEFEQMTAARLMPVVVQGKASMRWITPQGHREEGGDCMVYAYAAACHMGIQTNRETSWARREQLLQPAMDLFSAPALAPAPAAKPPDTPTPPATQPMPRARVPARPGRSW
jgi:phage terminase large subunit GpA-like protein